MLGLHRIYWVLLGIVPVGAIGGVLGATFDVWGVVAASLVGGMYGNLGMRWAYSKKAHR